MSIAEAQNEIAKAQEDIGEAWRGSIIDGIHAYSGYHDIEKLLVAIRKEYPDEYAACIGLAELDAIERDAIDSRDADQDHYDELRRSQR